MTPWQQSCSFYNADLLGKHRKDIGRVQRLADPCVATISLWIIAHGLGSYNADSIPVMAIAAGLTLSLTAQGFSLYKGDQNHSAWQGAARAAMTWATVIGFITVWLFLQKAGAEYSRTMMSIWFLVVGLWLVGTHLLAAQAARQMSAKQSKLMKSGFIGSQDRLELMQAQWLANGQRGNKITPIQIWPKECLAESISLASIENQIQDTTLDQIIVEEPHSQAVLEQILKVLGQLTCPVLLLPSWLDSPACNPRSCSIGGVPALQLWGQQATVMEFRLKRCIDCAASCLMLALLAPLLIAIGVLIKFDSAGPVLFRQRRYGINGEPFHCLKFRTMTVVENGKKVEQARRNDPRITRLGAILRRWSLDELPQLVNVWRGEMSLVGPRPHAEAHNEFYRHKVRAYMRRHSLKPGITGWAQVLGLRGETRTLEAMEARVKADLHYIHNWNLLFDLEILLLTLVRLRGKNAY